MLSALGLFTRALASFPQDCYFAFPSNSPAITHQPASGFSSEAHMKHLCQILLLLSCPFLLHTQPLIINELYNSSSSDEWVELLVIEDSLDVRGWDLRDFTSGGSPQDPLVFTSADLWASLRAGTLLVVARAASPLQEDLDPLDFLLIIRADNAAFFTGNEFLFAGSSDAIQIRTPEAVHVFGVSWGSGNSGSLPEPRAHFSGSSASNTSFSFNEDSLPELTNESSWTEDNPLPSVGAGNSDANSTWVSRLRSGINGAGTARVEPDTLFAGQSVSLSIFYYPDPQFPVNALRIILPSNFPWSRNVQDVTLEGILATLNVIGDTVYLTGATVTEDSATIHLHDVSGPDSTARYLLQVQSRITAYGDILPIPIVTAFGSPEPIAAIKTNDLQGIPIRLGNLVTIQGIVTVGNQFESPSYIQDNSAGIAVYDPTLSPILNTGDEVVVSGIVDHFNGLTELTTPVLHDALSGGNTVNPLTVTCIDLFSDGMGGIELYEGMLVQINVVTVGDTSGQPIPAWAVSGSGTNYRLFDSTGEVDIRIDANVDFVDTPAPQGAFDVVGVVGQYKTSPPFAGGYELLPRSGTDILDSGPIIRTEPVESEIEQDAITINWTTVNPGTSRVQYGLTPAYELGVVAPDDLLRTSHAVSLSPLSPATIYHVQAFSAANEDTSFTAHLLVSTASPTGTTGMMNVYFNRSVYAGVSTGEPALGDQDLTARILTRIQTARRSIDATMYNLGGTPGDLVADGLIDARLRGLRVRVICEADNRDNPTFAALENAGIPLIDDRFDPGNDGEGLMHDKFFLFDYPNGAPESVWVWTGSWNPTENQTTEDYQNAIEIQDVALAGAYALEFNEMWGSDSEVPDPEESRFGFRKRDNTPHRFVVSDSPVECYFSPGDRTTFHIKNALERATWDIAFSLFSFTLADVADLLIEQRLGGKRVRGVMDDDHSPEQYSHLRSGGVDVLLDPSPDLLHHKYAIIDATKGPNGPQWVITGSQNWSFNGENRNCENSIIVESRRIANLYLQEFAQRYYDAGGDDSITVDVRGENILGPWRFTLDQNYPNPFNPTTAISYHLPAGQAGLSAISLVNLRVFDLLGRQVARLVEGRQPAGHHLIEFDGSKLASGVYFIELRGGKLTERKKMVLLR